MAWSEDRGFAISAALDARMAFVRRTYAHLLAELVGVALVVYLGTQSAAMQRLALGMNPILVIGAFFVVALVTRKMLEGHRSMAVQYAAAGLWVLLLGLLVTPLAIVAQVATGSYAVLGEGAILTGCAFTGITAYVFFTKKDFSFLRGALWMVSWLMAGFAVVSWIAGWGLGAGSSIAYSAVGVVLMGGWVLHDTSNVLHHRNVKQHVAASVDLLIDFVYMFIHIVSILLNSRR
jgi:FtsH-binding integral membrane protein